MQIEVIKSINGAQNEQGNVLENTASELLSIRGYQVQSQLRLTGVELDLLCHDNISGKTIYVECKAYNDKTLSSDAVYTLIGKVKTKHYTEGWLICTGQLSKDAKGAVEEIEEKPQKDREPVCFYTSDRIIDALIKAKLILSPPDQYLKQQKINSYTLGDWILVISSYGKFWATTVLLNGIPKFYILFDAKDGTIITNEELFTQLKNTNFSLAKFDIWKSNSFQEKPLINQPIVEVEIGEKWSDYRPARPEHFVGRKKNIQDVIHFFSDVKKRKTKTRIFAIKGDSGMGKSSLIAKLRDCAMKSHKPNNLFLYAVDVRAANDASYILSSLVQCLQQAQKCGFGCNTSIGVTNVSNPIDSTSIKTFFDECCKKKQMIILVFDQFEELYSKSALYSIFQEARKLMLSVISACTNFIIGFAWKSDCTIPQEHPAYHIWHELSDLRFEVDLKPFTYSDAEQSLALFESELPEKIRPDIRKYLLENCQGYPWLLKKLCIHFHSQMINGMSQMEMENKTLDIASLFEKDLNGLSTQQLACVKFIAENAPADWFETTEAYSASIVQSLQNMRITVRRGDKINLYWDIFKDYVLSKSVPAIPFNYMPQSTSLDGLLRVCKQLDNVEPKKLCEIASATDFSESTVRNIIHDLIQFGIVNNSSSLDGILLSDTISSIEEDVILRKLRILFKRHYLTILISKKYNSNPINQQQIVAILKQAIPTAQHDNKTWIAYANKMRKWLVSLGYLKLMDQENVIYEDLGDINNAEHARPQSSHIRPMGLVFIGDAAPAKVRDAYNYIVSNGPQPVVHMKRIGFRNACSVLVRFGLLKITSAYTYDFPKDTINNIDIEKVLFTHAKEEISIKFAIETIKNNPTITPKDLGKAISEVYNKKWSQTSLIRIGGGIKIWAKWTYSCIEKNKILPLPGRKSKKIDNTQLTFDF